MNRRQRRKKLHKLLCKAIVRIARNAVTADGGSADDYWYKAKVRRKKRGANER